METKYTYFWVFSQQVDPNLLDLLYGGLRGTVGTWDSEFRGLWFDPHTQQRVVSLSMASSRCDTKMLTDIKNSFCSFYPRI